MSNSGQIGRLYRRFHLLLHALLLVATCFVVYSNGFHHAYNLDSGYGLLSNSYVRSLQNVPRYFTDPLTLTSLRPNADYRPVLQTTFAVNYAISGYDMWSWHLVQILLHSVCVLGLYALCRRILNTFHPEQSTAFKMHVPLVAAVIFAVHPTGSGVVNYLWARSSLLVAALLLPSIVLYLGRTQARTRTGAPWTVLLLYTLALFTKVEAVAALGVYFLCEVLRVAQRDGDRERASIIHDGVHALDRQTLRRLWPFLTVTLVYAVLRIRLVPDFVARARHASDVGGLDYLFTQVTAWWHYLLRWLAPVDLVADDLAYPVYRSLLEPVVLLAIAGWLAVAVVLKTSYRRHPHYTFLTLSALALISPTSSFMPLAEMVNEHRPYLPLAVLSLAGLIPLALALSQSRRREPLAKALASGTLVLLAVSFSWLTWERNQVFATGESYWRDVQAKAPSARSQVNLGRELMAQGHLDEARSLFEAALATAPNWYITHLNLGVLYQHQGRDDEALRHFNEAVRTERDGAQSLVFRGQFLLARHEYERAARDLTSALDLTVERFPVHMALATAYAGLGRADESFEQTRECYRLDPERTELSIVSIATPFWDSTELYPAGVHYFRRLDELMPDRWWVHENIGNLAAPLGRDEEAEAAFERAASLRGE